MAVSEELGSQPETWEYVRSARHVDSWMQQRKGKGILKAWQVDTVERTVGRTVGCTISWQRTPQSSFTATRVTWARSNIPQPMLCRSVAVSDELGSQPGTWEYGRSVRQVDATVEGRGNWETA